jgi:hypothetical protein
VFFCVLMSRTLPSETVLSNQYKVDGNGNIAALHPKRLECMTRARPTKNSIHAFSQKEESKGRGYWYLFNEEGERRFLCWSGQIENTEQEEEEDTFEVTEEKPIKKKKFVKK